MVKRSLVNSVQGDPISNCLSFSGDPGVHIGKALVQAVPRAPGDDAHQLLDSIAIIIRTAYHHWPARVALHSKGMIIIN